MKDRIKAIIEDKLGIDFSYDDENGNLYADLGFDFLDLAEILIEVEREYDISIRDEVSDQWQTIDDIVKTCEEYIKAKQ